MSKRRNWVRLGKGPESFVCRSTTAICVSMCLKLIAVIDTDSVFALIFGLLSFYERLMVLDSLNLRLRQIARFSSNVILDEMLSAKCLTRRKTTLPRTYANFSFHTFSCYETIIMVILLGGNLSLCFPYKHEFCLVSFVVGMQKKIQRDEVGFISAQ